jgi:hypothetical protein
MNKRQEKKRKTKALNRLKQLEKYHFRFSRQSGKSGMMLSLFESVNLKKHKPFNDIVKYLNKRNL